MFNFKGITNKKLETVDIKLLSGSNIKLSPSAMETIGLDSEKHRTFIDFDRTSNKFWIAAVPVVEDENGKVTSQGRKTSATGSFSHQNTYNSLGEKFAEYSIDKDSATEFEGVKYFSLTLDNDGAQKRADVESRNFDANAEEAILENQQADEEKAHFEEASQPEMTDAEADFVNGVYTLEDTTANRELLS